MITGPAIYGLAVCFHGHFNFMNNNTKARIREAHKSGSATFKIPHKVSGNKGRDYSYRTQVITVGYANRKSTRGKVGRC